MPDAIQIDSVGAIVSPSFPSGVESNDKRSNFAFHENGKSYSAHNPKRLSGCRLHIDGGLYADNRKKCDCGLLLQDARFYLIEFKGGKVDQGCEQLLETIKRIEEDYSRFGFEFYCRIVAQKDEEREGAPRISMWRQRLVKKIGATNGNGKFLVKEKKLQETI